MSSLGVSSRLGFNPSQKIYEAVWSHFKTNVPLNFGQDTSHTLHKFDASCWFLGNHAYLSVPLRINRYTSGYMTHRGPLEPYKARLFQKVVFGFMVNK